MSARLALVVKVARAVAATAAKAGGSRGISGVAWNPSVGQALLISVQSKKMALVE
jgi:altronate dehydratase